MLESFKACGRIPRFPNCRSITQDVTSVDRSCSLLVFISHNWIHTASVVNFDSEGNEKVSEMPVAEPIPDTLNNEIYELCVRGIQRILDLHAPDMQRCYIWIDFGCLNQDERPAAELKSLADVMRSMDCVFTPVLGENSNKSDTIHSWLDDYHVESWNQGEFAYLNRQWCRLEMFYGANIPLEVDANETSDSLEYLRLQKLRGTLRHYASQGIRPHLLYGSNEYKANQSPIFLDPISNLLFDKFHPEKGSLSDLRDSSMIQNLVYALQAYMHSMQVGYEGERRHTYFGPKHGQGREVYANGDVYDGEFANDLRNGKGVYWYSNGNVYDGEWKDNHIHGFGLMKYVNGNIYEGDWVDDHRTGKGYYFWASSGNYYTGEFKNGLANGKGTFTFCEEEPYDVKYTKSGKSVSVRLFIPAASVYTGDFVEGRREGYGRMQYGNNDDYDGEWRDDVRCGRGRIKYANGESFEGEWKSDQIFM